MKKYSPLHDALVIILWLSIIGTAYSIIRSFGALGEELFSYFELLLALASIFGAVLILRLNKNGYWMMVWSRILMALAGLLYASSLENASSYIVNGVLIRNLGQIVFLSLLMLLKKDGKNAYQVLWYKYNEDYNKEI